MAKTVKRCNWGHYNCKKNHKGAAPGSGRGAENKSNLNPSLTNTTSSSTDQENPAEQSSERTSEMYAAFRLKEKASNIRQEDSNSSSSATPTDSSENPPMPSLAPKRKREDGSEEFRTQDGWMTMKEIKQKYGRRAALSPKYAAARTGPKGARKVGYEVTQRPTVAEQVRKDLFG